MKISYNSLRDQAIDLVVEKGEDYRGYPGAYFRPDGAPGCLLGELLSQHGVDKSRMESLGINKAGVFPLKQMGVLMPADAATDHALHLLQRFNDAGDTWFRAVCGAFNMSPTELRTEIAERQNPVPSFDSKGYVDWVASYAEQPVVELKPLPVHAPVAPHVLAA